MGLLSGIMQRLKGGRPAGGGADTGPGAVRRAGDVPEPTLPDQLPGQTPPRSGPEDDSPGS